MRHGHGSHVEQKHYSPWLLDISSPKINHQPQQCRSWKSSVDWLTRCWKNNPGPSGFFKVNIQLPTTHRPEKIYPTHPPPKLFNSSFGWKMQVPKVFVCLSILGAPKFSGANCFPVTLLIGSSIPSNDRLAVSGQRRVVEELFVSDFWTRKNVGSVSSNGGELNCWNPRKSWTRWWQLKYGDYCINH